ncbi:PhnB protein [Labilithrix luteola]|uniref:PhnB protein n=1 Tax=Labilithrix luteola TaxID=1391654 RepID=A0A0K1Q4G2_9BACT|nr:YciI family protein [Labilithrix luteola]AKV00552.1 PhnB protein [Labilithrix luteola]
MRFVMLIAGDEKTSLKMSKEEGERIVAAYKAYMEDLQKAGVLLAGEALMPSATGARVTVTGGKRNVIDGPFSEAKEVIGGYFLIQVKSREEALEWASRCPAAQYAPRSFVEVRPVMEFPA